VDIWIKKLAENPLEAKVVPESVSGMTRLFTLLFCLFAGVFLAATELDFSFQARAFGAYEAGNETAFLQGDFLPELNISQNLGKDIGLMGEYSGYAFINGVFGDSTDTELGLQNYRAWLRIGNPQTALRIGLQRINFGSARVLRPLQWFDKLDPLDKSEFTEGVWALLATHTWLNNSNLWIWGMLGDEDLKGSETNPGKEGSLELGTRIQLPNPAGETGLAYHQRQAKQGDEYRAGFDHRWDGFVGAWLEGSVSMTETSDNNADSMATALTVGIDYTFPWGNGVAITAENLFGHQAKTEKTRLHITEHSLALLFSYPLGLLDTVTLLEIHSFVSDTDNLSLIWRRAYDYLAWELGLSLDRGFEAKLSKNPGFFVKLSYNL